MKLLRLVVFCLLLAGLTGCGSLSTARLPLQAILDQTFPKTFVGDAEFVHKNPYIDVTIVAKSLRNEDGVWRYESLSYKRNGRFSHGEITLTQSNPQ